jgi:hypothetical protein
MFAALIWFLLICTAAMDVPPSAMKTAIVAMTFA